VRATVDAADFRLLKALSACATASPEPAEELPRDTQVLRRYPKAEINLGKAAEEFGLSRLELQDRFLRLGAPLLIGPPRWRTLSARSLLSTSVPEPARLESSAPFSMFQPPIFFWPECANEDTAVRCSLWKGSSGALSVDQSPCRAVCLSSLRTRSSRVSISSWPALPMARISS
jgi:hypothetical protein